MYGIINFSYVKITGTAIYPPITWKDGLSYILGLVALVMQVTIIYFVYKFNIKWQDKMEIVKYIQNSCDIISNTELSNYGFN